MPLRLTLALSPGRRDEAEAKKPSDEAEPSAAAQVDPNPDPNPTPDPHPSPNPNPNPCTLRALFAPSASSLHPPRPLCTLCTLRNPNQASRLLEAVRGLRQAEPKLNSKRLVTKLNEQRPELKAQSKEVREALAALEAEGEPSTSSQGLESSTAAVQGAEKDDAGASTPSDVQARAAMLYLLWPTHCNPQSSCAGPWLGEHTNPSPNPDPNQVTRTLTLTLTLTHRSHLQHGPLRVPAGSRKR